MVMSFQVFIHRKKDDIFEETVEEGIKTVEMKENYSLCISDSTAFFMFSILCSLPPYVK